MVLGGVTSEEREGGPLASSNCEALPELGRSRGIVVEEVSQKSGMGMEMGATHDMCAPKLI
jgi:hypothetical protein